MPLCLCVWRKKRRLERWSIIVEFYINIFSLYGPHTSHLIWGAVLCLLRSSLIVLLDTKIEHSVCVERVTSPANPLWLEIFEHRRVTLRGSESSCQMNRICLRYRNAPTFLAIGKYFLAFIIIYFDSAFIQFVFYDVHDMVLLNMKLSYSIAVCFIKTQIYLNANISEFLSTTPYIYIHIPKDLILRGMPLVRRRRRVKFCIENGLAAMLCK